MNGKNGKNCYLVFLLKILSILTIDTWGEKTFFTACHITQFFLLAPLAPTVWHFSANFRGGGGVGVKGPGLPPPPPPRPPCALHPVDGWVGGCSGSTKLVATTDHGLVTSP